ncbi:F-box/kelch-repeat protein At3g06240-like [Primulina eburnea]|uniref:F-box/kelch-repeat protein At3g06240-like n=1 Tax=Primulina eburnea TaxID=1245227 RepID=UPI003C6C8552
MNKPELFLMDLPSEIVVGILSRLPTRTIVSCRCVCKQWHELLSTPEFAKSHLSVSPPGLLVLHMDPIMSEYRCNVVEYEDISQLQYGFPCDQVTKFDPRAFISSPAYYQIQTQGSVHGLLCLRYQRSKSDDVIYICNPITREYISLPRLPHVVEYANFTCCGFGVSSITGQYKVVHILQKSVLEAWQHDRRENYRCEFYEYLIYTLGTGSWRSIPENSPFEHAHMCFGVFLNGNLHGLVCNSSKSAMLVSCFDLEDESFEPFSPPSPLQITSYPGDYILRVLDDCLCICESTFLYDEMGFVFWMMKEYGVKESWSRQFIFLATEICPALPFYGISLIKGYKNGDILYSWEDETVYYYSNKTKTSHEVALFAQYSDSSDSFKTMLHSSSFLSLKSFDGENVISFADFSESSLAFSNTLGWSHMIVDLKILIE